MLNAAEAAMDAAADDDGARQRDMAKLYAPPKGERGPGRRRARPPGIGLDRVGAQPSPRSSRPKTRGSPAVRSG